MQIIVIIVLIIIGIFTILHGWAEGASKYVERKRVQKLLDERDKIFLESFGEGRKWLAEFVADCRKAYDDVTEENLRSKKRPALKAAEEVRKIKAEKKQLNYQLKILEYQVLSYEEYFPFLEEYRDAILDERVGLNSEQDNLEELNEADPVQIYLNPTEYKQLTPDQKSQLALERYLLRNKSNWEIGRMYERYLGYLYESDGWNVYYNGAIKGYEDFGRDLICTKGKVVEIVQAKCWAKEKIIREKYIFQLFGTAMHYRKSHPKLNVLPVFIHTAQLSGEAESVAEALNIKVVKRAFTTDYPMIKCNISPLTNEKIYHLPFDQQYDKTIIGDRAGEKYVKTVKEAEDSGFRRAWRYTGNKK